MKQNHSSNTSRDIQRLRRRNIGLSVLLCLICIAALILPMQGKQSQPYAFERAAGIDLAAARAAWTESGENESLYTLALALSREAVLAGEGYDASELMDCGRELYRRAKAETLDLEAIGDPEDTLAMIALLRDMGVTPAES